MFISIPGYPPKNAVAVFDFGQKLRKDGFLPKDLDQVVTQLFVDRTEALKAFEEEEDIDGLGYNLEVDAIKTIVSDIPVNNYLKLIENILEFQKSFFNNLVETFSNCPRKSYNTPGRRLERQKHFYSRMLKADEIPEKVVKTLREMLNQNIYSLTEQAFNSLVARKVSREDLQKVEILADKIVSLSSLETVLRGNLPCDEPPFSSDFKQEMVSWRRDERGMLWAEKESKKDDNFRKHVNSSRGGFSHRPGSVEIFFKTRNQDDFGDKAKAYLRQYSANVEKALDECPPLPSNLMYFFAELYKDYNEQVSREELEALLVSFIYNNLPPSHNEKGEIKADWYRPYWELKEFEGFSLWAFYNEGASFPTAKFIEAVREAAGLLPKPLPQQESISPPSESDSPVNQRVAQQKFEQPLPTPKPSWFEKVANFFSGLAQPFVNFISACFRQVRDFFSSR